MIFSDPRGRAYYAVMCLLSAAVMFLPRLYGPSAAGLALYAAHPYIAVLPLCLAGPFLCSLRGVPPIVSFFPPGLCFLMTPDYPGMAGTALVFLFVSLVSAEAGRERRARQGGEKTNHMKGLRKGAKRGGKKKKR